MRFLEWKTNCNISIRSKLLSARLTQKTLYLSTILNIIYTYWKGGLPQKIQCRSVKIYTEKWTKRKQLKLKTSAPYTDGMIKQQRKHAEQGQIMKVQTCICRPMFEEKWEKDPVLSLASFNYKRGFLSCKVYFVTDQVGSCRRKQAILAKKIWQN